MKSAITLLLKINFILWLVVCFSVSISLANEMSAEAVLPKANDTQRTESSPTTQEDLPTIENSTIVKRSHLLENSLTEQKLTEHDFSISKPQSTESLLQLLSSVSVSQPYNGISGVFFRGADSEKTLVIIDGVIMNDPTAPSGGFDYRFLQPNEIEEITIWSPGESVVWGSGALGGIISIRTKRAKVNGAYVGLGSYGTGRMGMQLSKKLSGWDNQFSVYGMKTDGFSAIQSSTGDFDKKIRGNLRGRATLESPHRVESLSFFVSNGQDDTDRSSPLSDDPNSGTQFQVTALSYELTFEGQNQSENILSLAAKNILRNDFDSVDHISNNYSFGRQAANELQFRYQYLRQLSEQFKIDAGLDSLNLFTQFDYADSTPSSSSFSKMATLSGLFTRIHYTQGGVSLVPGVRAQLSADGKVQLISSLRYQQDVGSSWKLEYHFASGLKEPTMYQTYSSYGYHQLRPEKVEYHHVGFGRDSAEQRYFLLFYQEWYQELIQFNTSTSKYGNISSANIKGAELQIKKNVGRARMFFSFAENFARDGQGLSLIRRPRQTAQLRSDHFMGKVQFSPSFLWKSEREDMNPSGQRVILSSGTQFDIGFKYHFSTDKLLDGAVRNILGSELVEAYGYQALGRQIEIGYQQLW